MKKNAVLFDLDGTLLPMDEKVFFNTYFGEIGKKAAELGYDAKTTTEAIWEATKRVMMNDGSAENIKVFWDNFTELLGEDARALKADFDKFYVTEFDRVKSATTANPDAKKLVKCLFEKGYTVALATNPVFPLDANKTRLSWIELSSEDFAHITSYENSRYCKPSTEYYKDILEALGKKPEECIMIGNDAREDMAAQEAGIEVFLVTDCLINTHGVDISGYKQGTFREMMEYLGC